MGKARLNTSLGSPRKTAVPRDANAPDPLVEVTVVDPAGLHTIDGHIPQGEVARVGSREAELLERGQVVHRGADPAEAQAITENVYRNFHDPASALTSDADGQAGLAAADRAAGPLGAKGVDNAAQTSAPAMFRDSETEARQRLEAIQEAEAASGYERKDVRPKKESGERKPASPASPYKSKTKDALKEEADSRGLDVSPDAKKDEIVAALEEDDAARSTESSEE